MNSKELLLSKRWILKQDDRDTYYKIKDESKELKKLFQDTLGYSLISHQNFIRLDKVPGKAEPWMGICEFHDVKEYQMLCYILIFLEDKDDNEPFILSYLTEFLQAQMNVKEEFWLKYANRKMFVNVLKFCLNEQLFLQHEGNSESFVQDENAEVLFENTGLSRYFMRSFVFDIYEKKTPEDFMKEDWVGMEQNRGIVRKQRIYRRLMLSCGIYKEKANNDDFSFIHNYRKRMEHDFQKICPSSNLQVYKSSAYLILEDDVRIGRMFPKNNAMDEMVILVLSDIRKAVASSLIEIDEDEMIILSKEQMVEIIANVINKNEKYLPAIYRQKKRSILIEELYDGIIRLGFAKQQENDIVLYPITGKIIGSYEEV